MSSYDDVLASFWQYEHALMANDLDALDRFFAPGDRTLRGDAAGLLVGHEAISRFRGTRGGAPKRRILGVHVREAGDGYAVLVAETAPETGGRGLQTQLWRRTDDGWVIEVAHVSAPAPAITPSVWRVVGAPLVPAPTDSGPLAGHRVAVKDLFAVEGFATGGGVPAFLAEQEPATRTAPAVTALLQAGASVQGIATTDEFAYSIAGRNSHYGAPANAAVRGALPGGSSSGPASAVALGQADIGLGTDTGGSIRVPASYQGLWGLRPTHGAVHTAGLLPLAPSFDTIGWLTRTGRELLAAASVSLSAPEDLPASYAIAPQMLDLLDPGVRDAFLATVAPLNPVEVTLPDLDGLFETFRTIQAIEAWHTHGAWIEAHPGTLGGDVAARFAFARSLSAEVEAAARLTRDLAVLRLESVLGDRVLLLPSASTIAPPVDADDARIEQVRAGTLRLTCIAGLLGRPAISVPLMTVDGAPVGLSLVGPRGSDLALIERGMTLAGEDVDIEGIPSESYAETVDV
ncbi:AtzH-like domain-containing protein [Herbiconiux sp. SYSU D00978]|uniref:AtzH-like domain-containing protein n=1 Tax=Herbiconiux sp. SYSU D00978 TaxID=2812562 RepID=UPI001A974DBB|nr:AtzH-like domain-containing protein [Herbiconiux sp. SYSU D00978]